MFDLVLKREETYIESRFPWTDHRVLAIDKNTGNSVGYIKVSYISSQDWDSNFHSGINYMKTFMGWCFGDNDKSKECLRYLSWYCFHDNNLYESINLMTNDELENLYWRIERHIKQRYFRNIVKTKNYWVDKPLVFFIRVNHLRQGIGSSLYLDAAKWMKEKGLFLYAATTQSHGARACWNRFLDVGLAKRVGKRIILDP